MALLITEGEVRTLLSPAEALQAVKSAHLALAKGEAFNEPRSRVRSPKMMLATMSAIDPIRGYGATKYYSATGPMVSCHVALYEAPSGKLLATLEGIELGRLRTAAATLLAIQTLAPSIKHLALIGAGFQSEGLLQSIHSVPDHGIESVFLASRTEARAKLLSERFNKVSLRSSAEQACRESEAVVTLTSSAEPVVHRDWLNGCHLICGVGSNSLARREIPPNLRFNGVVVDEVETAKRECGNLQPYIENGKLSWSAVLELGALLELSREEREKRLSFSRSTTPSHPLLFCSHGLAVQDLFLAQRIYEKTSGGVNLG